MGGTAHRGCARSRERRMCHEGLQYLGHGKQRSKPVGASRAVWLRLKEQGGFGQVVMEERSFRRREEGQVCGRCLGGHEEVLGP